MNVNMSRSDKGAAGEFSELVGGLAARSDGREALVLCEAEDEFFATVMSAELPKKVVFGGMVNEQMLNEMGNEIRRTRHIKSLRFDVLIWVSGVGFAYVDKRGGVRGFLGEDGPVSDVLCDVLRKILLLEDLDDWLPLLKPKHAF